MQHDITKFKYILRHACVLQTEIYKFTWQEIDGC